MLEETKIKERLDRDCHIMVTEVLSALKISPVAILLCGGYGRNEGAWYINEKGDVSPYNDYDLAIITNRPLSRPDKNILRKKLADMVGIKWVDIDFYSQKDLCHLKSTIHNVDLFYASTVLWGEVDLQTLNPKISARKIGNWDVVKLFNTRMWAFLGAWEGDFHDLNSEEAMFFQNQMAKAVLAAVDMILVSKKEYEPSYRQRVEKVKNYLVDIKERELVSWALEIKTRPTLKSISKQEMMDRYWVVKSFFCRAYKNSSSILGKLLLNPKFSNWYYYFGTHYVLSSIYERLVKHSNRVKKTRDIYDAQSLVFFSNDNGNIDNSLLTKASTHLRKWGYTDEIIADWNCLRMLVSQARNNI